MGCGGQALVEVAVFGAIFLMIIGAMITYGLRFDYNQRAQQQAFRRALKIASDRTTGGGSYMLLEDKYIPDPTDPFGIGSSMPVSASASIVRDNRLDARAGTVSDPNDLPTTVLDVQLGWTNDPAQEPLMQRYILRNAGFRYEVAANAAEGFTKNQVDKYKLIYGDVLAIGNFKYTNSDGDEEDRWTTVRIMDSCAGQIVDYDACYERATQLVDAGLCQSTCARNNKDSDIDCPTLCAQVLNPPNQNDQSTFNYAIGGPWYAAGGNTSSGYWVFPVLDKLFGMDTGGGATTSSVVGPQPTGLSGDSTSDVRRASGIDRVESTDHIVTQQFATMREQISRNIIIHDNIDPTTGEQFVRPAAADAYAGDVIAVPLNSDIQVNVNETWSTEKHRY